MKTGEMLIWGGVAYLGYVWFVKPQAVEKKPTTEQEWLDWFTNLFKGTSGSGGNSGGGLTSANKGNLSSLAVMPAGPAGANNSNPGGNMFIAPQTNVLSTTTGLVASDNPLVMDVDYYIPGTTSTPPTLPGTSGGDVYVAELTGGVQTVVDPRTWQMWLGTNDGGYTRKNFATGVTAQFKADGTLWNLNYDDGTPAFLGTNETLPYDLQSIWAGGPQYSSGTSMPGPSTESNFRQVVGNAVMVS